MERKDVVKALHKAAGRLLLKKPVVVQSKKVYNRKKVKKVVA
jgi:hypothetical protein